MQEYPFISVVIPVKNQADLLNRCLESLKKLDYPKTRLEVIIADGMSQDKTRDIALSFGAKVVDNEKEIVVSGRNRGYEASQGEIIAFTDADCIFESGWLKNSIKYFKDHKIGAVGGVSLAPSDSSDFEKAVEFIFSLSEFFKTTSHRKEASTPRLVDDIPGCNAIYRRSALENVMPVDETLLTAEDAWMNFKIRRYGYKFIYAPDVRLWHYRRSSPKKFLRQNYRFAIGRLQAGKRSPKLLNCFHIFVGFAIPVMLSGLGWIYLAGKTVFLIKTSVFLLIALIFSGLIKTRSFLSSISLPLVAILFVCAWSTGFLRELFFPLKDVRGK